MGEEGEITQALEEAKKHNKDKLASPELNQGLSEFQQSVYEGPEMAIDRLGFSDFFGQFVRQSETNSTATDLIQAVRKEKDSKDPVVHQAARQIDQAGISDYSQFTRSAHIQRLTDLLDNVVPRLPIPRNEIELQSEDGQMFETFLPQVAYRTIRNTVFDEFDIQPNEAKMFIYQAGSHYRKKDGAPDLEKIKKLSHPHFFYVIRYEDFADVFFVDPEFMLADRTVRPPVTNLVGVRVHQKNHEEGKIVSLRHFTASDVRNLQKGRLQLSLIGNMLDPEIYPLEEELQAANHTPETVNTLTSFQADANGARIVSKFTPKSIMRRVAKGESPGPEVTNQIVSTLMVLGGAVNLIRHEDNWKDYDIQKTKTKPTASDVANN